MVELLEDPDDLRRTVHHRERWLAGTTRGRLERTGATGVPPGDGQGRRHPLEGAGIVIDKVEQRATNLLRLSQQAADVILHIRIAWLAQCEVARHGGEGCAEGAHIGSGATATGSGLPRRQLIGKVGHALPRQHDLASILCQRLTTSQHPSDLDLLHPPHMACPWCAEGIDATNMQAGCCDMGLRHSLRGPSGRSEVTQRE